MQLDVMQVTKTPNAESPLVHGETPLLTMDVWEHACRHPAASCNIQHAQ